MMLNLILWYLVVALAGWLVFPLAFRLLSFLPDRGLAVSRPLGLLLWGYTYWLLVSLGVLQNDTGGALFALLLVGGLSLWRFWSGGWKGGTVEIGAWLRERRALVLATELLFLALFVFMALVRAANPDASGTEKPMELAFINSILRSPAFPPADPWLSGYAISYYYFGYVMVAALARISGTSGGVAFNLALATWFALSGLAAYGLLYNLLAAAGTKTIAVGKQALAGVRGIFGALFAPLFLLIAGNLEGFLELLHAGKVFWASGPNGNLTSRFWSWLDIQELTTPPSLPFDWEPQRAGGIWWWRASRVLQDYTVNGQSREIIDEFPAFSYVLGDLHPHVLAMPFVLLAASLALNVYLKLRDSDSQLRDSDSQLRDSDSQLAEGNSRLRVVDWLRTADFWLAALALGGLSFLNTWDFPISLALFSAAVALAHLVRTGWRWGLVAKFLETALPLLLAGVLLYLPFYLGFASQANGLLPSLVFFTRGIHFWVMFGTLLLPVIAWLVWLSVQWWRAGRAPRLLAGLLVAGTLIGGLWLLSVLFGMLVLSRNPGLAGATWGTEQIGQLLQASLSRRFFMVIPPGSREDPSPSFGMWLTLLGLLALVWGLVQANHGWRKKGAAAKDSGAVEERTEADGEDTTGEKIREEDLQAPVPSARADLFVLLLILLGAGLALFPEFFYLRDQFGWRMNTIFKFYYQTWVVWAVAAGYASAMLVREISRTEISRALVGIVYSFALIILLSLALVYPFYGFGQTLESFDPQTATLDGTAYLERYSPDDMEAIRWLQNAPYGTIAEAIGGSYSGYARVSTMSGMPAVLGWPGHESQWRGGEEEKGTREADIIQLYKARRWDQVDPILEKYQIRYVYIGSLERSNYRPNDSLFQQNLQPVFRNGSVTIYEYPRYNSEGELSSQP